MARKHRVTPPEQKIIDGNTPMMTARDGKKYPMSEKQKTAFKEKGFQTGVSGNPAGRYKEEEVLKTKMYQRTEEMIDVLADIALNGTNEASRVKAASLFLDPFVSKAATKHEADIRVDATFGAFLVNVTKDLESRADMIRAETLGLVIDHESEKQE